LNLKRCDLSKIPDSQGRDLDRMVGRAQLLQEKAEDPLFAVVVKVDVRNHARKTGQIDVIEFHTQYVITSISHEAGKRVLSLQVGPRLHEILVREENKAVPGIA
jgi:hypothetical protein